MDIQIATWISKTVTIGFVLILSFLIVRIVYRKIRNTMSLKKK
jgi:hypothetical protein